MTREQRIHMGLFDWFKSAPSNVTILDDVIWMTNEARVNGIARAISQWGAAAYVVAAHFQDAVDELQKIVTQCGAPELITVCKVDVLERCASRWTALNDSQSIEFLIGERHPLRSHDERVIEFARRLPCQSRVVHHLSLADPLCRAFAGEWVESVLKKLGMADDEAVESNLVARQIKKAQMKIASQATGDSPADSAETWMEINCREMWNKVGG